VAPSVVWLDEIDVLGASRDQGDDSSGGGDAVGRRTLSALLAELDGVCDRDGVLILAATSRLSHVDSALLRPGRFDRVLRIPPPTHADRVAIVASHLRRAPASRVTADDVERIAALTDSQTGADLAALHREVAFAALQDAGDAPERATIEMRHFLAKLGHRHGL
jgi:SpoVK/Ycf46/Vps4 family AAA+-type ATPase